MFALQLSEERNTRLKKLVFIQYSEFRKCLIIFEKQGGLSNGSRINEGIEKKP